MISVLPSKAPNLAVATPEYQQRYQDQLNNQLRLYFSKLDSNNQQIIQQLNSLSVMNWLGEGSF
jgi:hypothetical protein